MFLIYSQRTVVETKAWDVFRDPPPKIDSGSMANQRCAEVTVQITKVIVYLLVFVIVLGSGVIAKGTILFMTSQLKAGREIVYCNIQLGKKFMQLSDKWYRSILRLVKISFSPSLFSPLSLS